MDQREWAMYFCGMSGRADYNTYLGKYLSILDKTDQLQERFGELEHDFPMLGVLRPLQA